MKDCDFIPADYHAAQAMRGAIKLRAGCIGTLLAIMAVWGVAHHHRVESAKAMGPEIVRQQEQLTIHLAKKASMEAERAALRSHQELLKQLEEQTSLVLVFSDISRRIPETVVLTEVSAHCPSLARFASEVESPKPEETPAAPPGARPPMAPPEQRPEKSRDGPASRARVTIKGIAVDNPEVARFAASLEASPLFDRIQMEIKGPTIWGRRRAEQFELSCELVEQQGGGR